MFDAVKEWIRDNANLSLKAEIQMVANKEEIQVNSSDIQCIKLSLEVQEEKLGRLEGQIKYQEARLESQEQRLGKLETLVQQKEDKIQALGDRVEAFHPVYPQVVAEVILAAILTNISFGVSRTTESRISLSQAVFPETE